MEASVDLDALLDKLMEKPTTLSQEEALSLCDKVALCFPGLSVPKYKQARRVLKDEPNVIPIDLPTVVIGTTPKQVCFLLHLNT